MRLEKYLKENGITQLQFSKDIDISKIHAQNVIRERAVVGRKLAKKIEEYTGYNVSRLELLYPDESFNKTIKTLKGKGEEE